MVIPVIGVTLPETTSAAEVTTLLEACDQAFLEGECRQLAPSEPTFDLDAHIEWLSSTQARVTITRERDGASDSEDVSFVEGDEAVERYRALGFSIGSLGSAFVAGAKREPDPKESEPPAEEPAPKIVAPTPEPRVVDPPDPVPEAPSPPETSLPEAISRFHLELGAIAGNGLGRPRLGGEFGAWAPIYGRWTIRLAGNVAVQEATADGLDATFFGASAGLGARFLVSDTLLALLVGAELQQLQASLGEAELLRAEPAMGPFVGGHARLLHSRLGPFVTVRAAAVPVTRVQIENLDSSGDVQSRTQLGTHGPLQVDAVLGVSLSLGP